MSRLSKRNSWATNYERRQSITKEQLNVSYDVNAEKEARQWIQSITGNERIGKISEDFHAVLKDGVILCELLNTIKPKTVKKIHKSTIPYKQIENISNFTRGCRTLGVAGTSASHTVHLHLHHLHV